MPFRNICARHGKKVKKKFACERDMHEKILLDSDEWKKGILIRPFYGRILDAGKE